MLEGDLCSSILQWLKSLGKKKKTQKTQKPVGSFFLLALEIFSAPRRMEGHMDVGDCADADGRSGRVLGLEGDAGSVKGTLMMGPRNVPLAGLEKSRTHLESDVRKVGW